MTQPRCVLAGMTVMITRRSLRRTMLLRPDPELTQLYLYCLAVVAARHGIQVHAAVLMSTHEHIIVTDRQGRLPHFLRELHRLVALGVKVLRKWEGAVWDHERPSVVHLRTQQALIEKLAYVMANPVQAGLVSRAKDWPGLQTLPEQIGHLRLQVSRPAYYFDAHNPQWPSEASLEFSLPELGELSADQLRAAVAEELGEQERNAHAMLKLERKAVLGAPAVRRCSPYKRARSFEPLRERNPQFAVGRGQKDALFAAVAALRAFRRAYREALAVWRRGGVRDFAFPAGTWLMSVLHGALTESC